MEAVFAKNAGIAERRGSKSMLGCAVTRIEKAAYGVQQIRKARIIITTIRVTSFSGFLEDPSLL